jgi:membrane complex biogenesis BtpA family protein
MKTFLPRRAVVGMVHLLPLPGSPRARSLSEVLRRAKEDARALARGGVDGLLVENFGDAPFSPGPAEPHVVAAMATAGIAVREATGLPLGINVLRNDARGALAVAMAAGASFIRVNVHVGAAETDQGRIEGRAYETLRYRRTLGSPAAIFADVFVKHAWPAGGTSLERAARESAYRGLADVLLVTGTETGGPVDPERLGRVKRAVPDRPVYVASGISPENASLYPEADGFIVGTALKRGGKVENPVDPRRVQSLVRTIKGMQSR